MTEATTITIRRATAADAGAVTEIYNGPAATAGTFLTPSRAPADA